MKSYTKIVALVAVLLVVGVFLVVASNKYQEQVASPDPVSQSAFAPVHRAPSNRINQTVRIIQPQTITQTVTVLDPTNP